MKALFSILFTLVVFNFSFAQTCPDSLNIYTFYFNGQKYEIVKDVKTWVDASACAVARGGILAEISSQAENDSLFYHLNNANLDLTKSRAQDGGGAVYAWLGGNDLAEEGRWVWDGNNDNSGMQFWQGTRTGNRVNDLYNNWGSEPDNFNNQDALGLAITTWSLGSPGKWNDVIATNKLYSIIEYGSRTARIDDVNYLYESETLVIKTFFSASFDSMELVLNDSVYTKYSNISDQDSTLEYFLPIEISTILNISLRLYYNGQIAAIPESSIEVFSFNNPQNSYITDFEGNVLDNFLGERFSIERPFGFKDKAIHSKHDYENSENNTFTLRTPIIVSSADSRMIWSDVAIIQPGDSGSVYNDPGFKDYVIVEGSKKENEWLPLLDGYDARLHPEWENAWKNGGQYRKLFKSHSVDLSETYNTGDTILIRFRLFSDARETGWGWVIDSLQIQNFSLAIEELEPLPQNFLLQQNYPNPFNPKTVINYSVSGTHKASTVRVVVFDINGRQITTLVDELKLNGKYSVSWQGTNTLGTRVASGVYYVSMFVGKRQMDTIQVVLLK
jgi:FlgD Ig-like domain